MPDPSIASEALKHGVTRAEIREAIDTVLWVYRDQGDHELTLTIGLCSSRDTPIEVGWRRNEKNERRVVHAMAARAQYLKQPTR